jgi:hypothetical protein
MGHLDPAAAIAAFNAQAQSEDWPVRCEVAGAFDSRELTDIFELWRSRAGGDQIPARDEFDLRTLKGAARLITIVELVNEHDRRRYRMRLVGSGVVQVFGESTGRYLDEVVPAPLVPSWLAGYDLILSQAVPLRFQSWFRIPGADHLRAESFCAPLRGSGLRPDMVLGASAFSLKDRPRFR